MDNSEKDKLKKCLNILLEIAGVDNTPGSLVVISSTNLSKLADIIDYSGDGNFSSMYDYLIRYIKENELFFSMYGFEVAGDAYPTIHYVGE